MEGRSGWGGGRRHFIQRKEVVLFSCRENIERATGVYRKGGKELFLFTLKFNNCGLQLKLIKDVINKKKKRDLIMYSQGGG